LSLDIICSSRNTHGKPFTSRKQIYEHISADKHFCTNWRLLFVYYSPCLLYQVHFYNLLSYFHIHLSFQAAVALEWSHYLFAVKARQITLRFVILAIKINIEENGQCHLQFSRMISNMWYSYIIHNINKLLFTIEHPIVNNNLFILCII